MPRIITDGRCDAIEILQTHTYAEIWENNMDNENIAVVIIFLMCSFLTTFLIGLSLFLP